MTFISGEDRFAETMRGLRIHYVAWGNSDNPPLLLCHGWMDIARSWDRVAPRLARSHYVLAIDFRGHGLSHHVGAGGYYHFPDYLFDILAVANQEAKDRPLVVVGHSMGGMATGYFCGTYPERVSRYVNIEGFGPPESDPGEAPERFAKWVTGVESELAKQPRPYESLEDVAGRLKKTNPRLADDFALHLARHSTHKGEDGRYRFTFDLLHKTRSPQPFYVEQSLAFWRRISAPTLAVIGAQSVFKTRIADWHKRLAALPDARMVEIPGAGHMIHHEDPEALADVILQFLNETADAVSAAT